MQEEEWRAYDDNYEVSNLGKVRRNGHVLNGSLGSSGYRHVIIYNNGTKKIKDIHSLVSHCFLGEKPEGLVCDHIDRDRLNNCVSNLRYITQKENSRNSSRYRSDIEETDPILRRKILNKLWYDARCLNIRRKKNTGSVYKLKTGKYRASIKINGVTKSKSFNTKLEAETYLDDAVNYVNTLNTSFT